MKKRIKLDLTLKLFSDNLIKPQPTITDDYRLIENRNEKK